MKRIYSHKTKRVDKLPKEDQESLVFDLIHAFTQTHNVGEAAIFLQDLLTKAEMKILGKRLRIAKLLLDGMTYDEIAKNLYTSHATVAKIGAWLAERGDGFRKIIEKLPKQKRIKNWTERSDWDSFKRRYSLYFWPELLLEEVVKSANEKQKGKMREVLERLEEKSNLHRKIEQLLKPNL